MTDAARGPPHAGIVEAVLRTFLSARWIRWHVLLLASLATLGWIGYWQLHKALTVGNWQNYGYAIQWWLFGGFAVFLWVKMILDELDPTRAEGRERRELEVAAITPTQRQAAPPTEDEDDELAAYNRHLAELAERGNR